jgi:thiol-disulfide isomerase/thioredoxin
MFNANLLIGIALGFVLSIVLLVISSIAIYRYGLQQKEAELVAPPVPGVMTADFDWDLSGLDGSALSLSSLEGDVIFVTFWSPECPHCVIEMGYIQELYDIIAAEGVAFVCATADQYRDSAKDYATKRGLTMPLYSYKGGAPAVYKHRITPAAFIIGRDGKIAWSHEGAAKWSDDTMVQYLRGLLIKKE